MTTLNISAIHLAETSAVSPSFWNIVIWISQIISRIQDSLVVASLRDIWHEYHEYLSWYFKVVTESHLPICFLKNLFLWKTIVFEILLAGLLCQMHQYVNVAITVSHPFEFTVHCTLGNFCDISWEWSVKLGNNNSNNNKFNFTCILFKFS